MDLGDILSIGAKMIQNNSDEATTGLDLGDIAGALGGLLGGGNSGGGLDLGSIIGKLSEGGFGDVVASWIGSGENLPIGADQVKEVLGSDVVSEFASKLGLNEESAAGALADALPHMVDHATNGDESLAGQLLEQVGGIGGALDMVKKMFG